MDTRSFSGALTPVYVATPRLSQYYLPGVILGGGLQYWVARHQRLRVVLCKIEAPPGTDFLKSLYFSVLSTYLWGPDPGKPEKPKISAGYGSFFEKRFLPICPMGEVIFKSLIARSNRRVELYNFVEQMISRKCQKSLKKSVFRNILAQKIEFPWTDFLPRRERGLNLPSFERAHKTAQDSTLPYSRSRRPVTKTSGSKEPGYRNPYVHVTMTNPAKNQFLIFLHRSIELVELNNKVYYAPQSKTLERGPKQPKQCRDPWITVAWHFRAGFLSNRTAST